MPNGITNKLVINQSPLENTHSILDRLQHFDILQLHRLNLQRIFRHNDQISVLPPLDRPLYMLFVTLIGRVDGDTLQSLHHIDLLLLSQNISTHRQSVDCTPDRHENPILHGCHRRIVVQSKVDFPKKCRSSGTNPLGSLWSQESIAMFITPVVRMSHKKGRNRSEFFRLVELVVSDSLRVDYSYPRFGRGIEQLCLFDSLDVDIYGCVSIAVRQNIDLSL